jgi:hypothetical protein
VSESKGKGPSPQGPSGVSFNFNDAHAGQDDEGHWGGGEVEGEEEEREARRDKAKTGKKGGKDGKEKKKGKAKSPREEPKKGKGKAKAGKKAVHKARKARDEEEEEDDGVMAGLPHFFGMTKTTLWKSSGMVLKTSPTDGEEEDDREGEDEEEERRSVTRLDVHDPIKTLRALWADGQDDDDEEEEEEEEEEGHGAEEGGEEWGRGEEGTDASAPVQQSRYIGRGDSDDDDDEEEEEEAMDQPLGLLTFRVPLKSATRP